MAAIKSRRPPFAPLGPREFGQIMNHCEAVGIPHWQASRMIARWSIHHEMPGLLSLEYWRNRAQWKAFRLAIAAWRREHR